MTTIEGEIQVSIPFRPERSRGPIVAGQKRVARAVRECRSCELVDRCSGPVPFDVMGPVDLLVVGEAPGPEEDRRGVPFVGPSGKLLRSVVDKAVGRSGLRVGYANVVSCFPNADGQIAKPTVAQVAACRANLVAQVHASDARWVLLVGGYALSTVRPDMTVTRDHGLTWLWHIEADQGSAITVGVGVTWHPAAILRGTKKRTMTAELTADVEAIVALAQGQDPLAAIRYSCYHCSSAKVDWLDGDGIAWCKAHKGMSPLARDIAAEDE